MSHHYTVKRLRNADHLRWAPKGLPAFARAHWRKISLEVGVVLGFLAVVELACIAFGPAQ